LRAQRHVPRKQRDAPKTLRDVLTVWP